METELLKIVSFLQRVYLNAASPATFSAEVQYHIKTMEEPVAKFFKEGIEKYHPDLIKITNISLIFF